MLSRGCYESLGAQWESLGGQWSSVGGHWGMRVIEAQWRSVQLNGANWASLKLSGAQWVLLGRSGGYWGSVQDWWGSMRGSVGLSTQCICTLSKLYLLFLI